jgi:hydrogenase nickel incorporation protein HypA/HybF
MHEISLVRNIFLTIEEQHPELQPENLLSIHLQIGELSNVEPVAMQNAFEAVVETDQRYRDAKLLITVTPILIYCDACDKTTGISDYHFVCTCGKPSKNIVQGDEMLITKIEYLEPDKEPIPDTGMKNQ